ncbi:MAG TPA: N-acetylmuramoyl-L-alanine amidase, partial [Candidatus Eisenbacteria bacterium]|nr:N-acetylmuramoyl-L-alanine amidase [Candidatus Eisenbacteria bacterium]
MRWGWVAGSFAPGLLPVLAALVAGPAPARADAPLQVVLQAVRSWSAPASTRIVFDFSVPVAPVAPDSGATRQLAVSVPIPGLTAAPGVPSVLAVGDSAVDTVFTSVDLAGAHFVLRLAAGTTFRVFTLAADADKPFRVVVDVTRVAAAAAEERRLAQLAAGKRQNRVRIVVVDAGHGGDDTGAKGPGGVLEKNVTLAIARQLAAGLQQVPGVQALLTRDGDYFIPLRERYRFAEKAHADLFISIHCNSSRRRGHGSGTEVYFLSLKGATDQSDADLANMENAADLVGGVPPQAEDDVVSVLYEVKRNVMLERSQLLAETLLDNLAADRRVESRGIKQAGFAVLKSVEFPSVLVETAFINNPHEARLLRDPGFQRRIADQLATGVRAYFARTGVNLGAPADDDGGSRGAVAAP